MKTISFIPTITTFEDARDVIKELSSNLQTKLSLIKSQLDQLQQEINNINQSPSPTVVNNNTNGDNGIMGPLKVVNAIPRVKSLNRLQDSALSDDGTVIAGTRLVDITKTIRSTGFQDPVAGKGIELKYDTGTDVGILLTYNRTGAAFLPTAIYGSTVNLLPQTGDVEVTGNINTSGIYKKGGVSGISTTITTAKLTPAGANGSMTFSGGILTASTPAT